METCHSLTNPPEQSISPKFNAVSSQEPNKALVAIRLRRPPQL